MAARASLLSLTGLYLAKAASITALAASLSGCFAYTTAPAFGPNLRAELAELPGAYAPSADDGHSSPKRGAGAAFEIREESWGVYRLTGAPASLDPETQTTMRALSGDCSGLELAEERAECSQPDAGMCDEEGDAASRAACLRFMGALRAEPGDHPMPQREWAAVEAVRWVAEGLPYRDEIIFTTWPIPSNALTVAPGVRWAVAQARRVISIGPLTDFEILGPQILPLDLLLIRVDTNGLTVFATQDCVRTGASGDAVVSNDPETLKETFLNCALRAQTVMTATDSDALERRYFKRSD